MLEGDEGSARDHEGLTVALRASVSFLASGVLASTLAVGGIVPREFAATQVNRSTGIQEMAIAGPPSCADCQLVLTPLVRLGKPTDPVVSTEASSVARDSRGRFYVTAAGFGQVIAYDASGNFIRALGKSGQGPGESQRIAHFLVGPGDSVWVLDASGRGLVYDPSLVLARSFQLPVRGSGFVPDTGGNVVVLSSILTAESAGLPLHVFSETGNRLASFGSLNPAYNPSCLQCMMRRLVSGSDARSVWLAYQTSYRIEEWTSGGQLRRALTRDASWFRPRTRDIPLEIVLAGPDPSQAARVLNEIEWQQLSVHIDSAGRLWYGFGARDHPDGPLPRMEVVDVRTGRLIASVRTVGMRFRWVDDDIVATPEHDTAGYVSFQVSRVTLRAPVPDRS